MQALDLFAGPGGWDEGLRGLVAPLGVEWDADACATRVAAGHPTLQADVAELEPREFTGTELLLASPPCQAFSIAGKQRGNLDRERILIAMERLAEGVDRRVELADGALDARAMLVVEPLRFALELRPRFIAFEQVPPVLPLWEVMAEYLEAVGYATWTGVLNAEEYGVAQTRRRAILTASLDGPAAPPAPTHARYNPRATRLASAATAGLLPWVSMADALGWPPSDLVGFPRKADRGEAITIDGAEYRARDLRPASEPSFGLTEKARSWKRFFVAAGITGEGRPRPTDTAPAATITGKGTAYWLNSVEDWHAAREAATPEQRVRPQGVRVTLEEAAVLQSFPADYPWQGSRTSSFLQVGNAIPPLMARAIVGALVGASLPEEQAA